MYNEREKREVPEMKGKIFQNMVAVGTVVFALCVTIFMGALY